MKGKMTEAEKNFIVCAILMLCCGIGMIMLHKMTMAIAFLAISVFFFIVPIVMYAKGDRIYDETTVKKDDKKTDRKQDKKEE